jgi:hypothetical protein
MSGVVKTVKKVFKKVVNVVKKIIKPVLIGAAIYFTAGIALSAFASTAGFAASMPGFAGGGFLGTGIGAGSVAGTGLFSQGAVALGVGGGLTSGAIGAGTTVAELAAVYGPSTAIGAAGAAGVIPAGVASGAQATIAGNAAAIAGGTGAAGAAANVAAMGGVAPAAGLIPKAAGAVGSMSFSDKLLMTKIATDTAGALFGPTPAEEAEALAIEQAKFRGAFYGMNADGSTAADSGGGGGMTYDAPAPVQQQGPPPMNTATGPQAPNTQPGGTVTPEQQALLDGRAQKERFPSASTQPGMTSGPGAMQSQLPVPGELFAPGENVRYV